MKRRMAQVQVSDHALLRWMEHVDGLDVEAIRSQIAARALIGAQLGAAAIAFDDVRLVLRDTRGAAPGNVTVVTTLPRNGFWTPRP